MEEPDFPIEMAHIWSAFLDMNSGRQQGFSGPQGLPFTEIKAWCELTNTDLSPFEVDALKRLDQTYLKVSNG